MEPESHINQSSGPETFQSVAQPDVAPKPIPVPPQKRPRTPHQKATDAAKIGNRKRSQAWDHFTIIPGVHLCLKQLFDTDVESKVKEIENHLNVLFSQYSKNLVVNDKSGSPRIVGEKGVCDGDGENIYSMLAKEVDDFDGGSELTKYLIGLEKGDNLNVLDWWKLNSPKYPVLSRIAKDILAIPTSTVASEQAFSTSGRVIDLFRSSLRPKTVEALVCAQDWLRDGPLVDIWETLDDTDRYEDAAQESSSSCVTNDDDDSIMGDWE